MRKIVLLFLLAAAACGTWTAPSHVTSPADAKLPRPDHIVIVFEENKDYEDIIDSPHAPYINSLAKMGASLTFYAFHHPSQPNYFEFFAGTNTITLDGKPYTVTGDDCVKGLTTTRSLGGVLGKNFLGFAEGWDPKNPSACCTPATNYVQRHAPWTMFADAQQASRTFADFQNTPFDQLPLVSMIAPDLINDMHAAAGTNSCGEEGPIPELVKNGDTWLQKNLDAYVQWAMKNNSLLIITFDENARAGQEPDSNGVRLSPPKNHIATILVGPMVKPGSSGDAAYNHYDLLRTIEDMYGLPHIGNSGTAKRITGIWQ